MERNEELIKMIIRFYNLQAGCSLSVTGRSNVALTHACLEKVDGDVSAVKTHIKNWVKEHENDGNGALVERFSECMCSMGSSKKEDVSHNVDDQAVGSAMGLLEQAVVGLIAKTSAERIEAEIMGSVKTTIQDFIKSEYGAIERKITTVIDGEHKELKGIQHEKFETVLKFVANNEPVFLTGPAGSGKNVLCKQIAEALGLDFYFTNAVTQEYKLTGFTDAMGNFQETQFYKAFKNGGLFMLDEMDASIPEVLVILNAAIANRYFDFPAPIGYVEAHPNFRVIAAGNTVGQGASYEYVGRNQLDAASLDRFAVEKIEYSEQIENSVACGDLELANFAENSEKPQRKQDSM